MNIFDQELSSNNCEIIRRLASITLASNRDYKYQSSMCVGILQTVYDMSANYDTPAHVMADAHRVVFPEYHPLREFTPDEDAVRRTKKAFALIKTPDYLKGQKPIEVEPTEDECERVLAVIVILAAHHKWMDSQHN